MTIDDHVDNETISVIIPVYNGSKYLDEYLDSVINQRYKDLQIIIIDEAKKVAVGYRKIYHYRIDNSTSGMAKFRPSVAESSILTTKIIRDGLVAETPELVRACKYAYWQAHLVMLSIMISCDETEAYPELFNRLKRETRRGALIK